VVLSIAAINVRILLLDDDDHVRAFLVRALEYMGHQVHALASGRHLADVLRTHEFEAVITDVFMPDMDGFQALAVLKATRPGLPVVVMSGGSATLGSCLPMATRMGAAAILEKPISLGTLADTLRSVAEPGPIRPAA
jgi:two-component system response regulator GlrR